MSHPSDAGFGAPLRAQLDDFLDHHRRHLGECLEGLTDEEVRRRLVPSATTLLGLVKHATFVEQVWFDEALTGRSRELIGIPATVDESFALTADDTVPAVLARYAEVCAASRAAVAAYDLDDVVSGNRRGALPLRWIYLHVLREIAHHCGHADILREQVLDSR